MVSLAEVKQRLLDRIQGGNPQEVTAYSNAYRELCEAESLESGIVESQPKVSLPYDSIEQPVPVWRQFLKSGESEEAYTVRLESILMSVISAKEWEALDTAGDMQTPVPFKALLREAFEKGNQYQENAEDACFEAWYAARFCREEGK